jgi:hypothetical protein
MLDWALVILFINLHASSLNWNEELKTGKAKGKDRKKLDAVYPDVLHTLGKRKKYQRLSYSEKLQIFKMIKLQKMKHYEISSLYKVSTFTIYSIIKEFEYKSGKTFTTGQKYGSKLLESKPIQNLIHEFLKIQKDSFT